MKAIIALLFLLALPLTALAQMPSPTTQLNEMKKLSYMIGQWKGSGWMEQGGKRETFTGIETVQSKLNGLALLVEGKFNADVGGKEATIHETLAVLSFDERAQAYRFRTYLASGITGDQEVKLVEGGWQWGFQFLGSQIRYTIKVNDNKEWHEVGEMSQDGKTWHQNFEMILKRVK